MMVVVVIQNVLYGSSKKPCQFRVVVFSGWKEEGEIVFVQSVSFMLPFAQDEAIMKSLQAFTTTIY